MYLNRLSDKQKELVLELLIMLANADQNFADEEKLIIDQYCAEMNIASNYEVVDSQDSIISELVSVSTRTELKMILIELAGLALSDKKFVEEEKKLIDIYLDRSGISKDDAGKAFELINALSTLYSDIDDYVSK